MRRIEWRHLPGAFAKPRRSQVQKSKDGLYFCPIDFCDHIMGFYLKEDAESTPRPSMVGISTLTINQKSEDDPINPILPGLLNTLQTRGGVF